MTDPNISSILRPSNHLMSALRSLMTSIDSLGLVLEQLRTERIPQRLLAAFEGLLAAGLPVEHAPDQVVWDLMFVKEMRQVSTKKADTERAEDNDTSKDIINSHLQEVRHTLFYGGSKLTSTSEFRGNSKTRHGCCQKPVVSLATPVFNASRCRRCTSHKTSAVSHTKRIPPVGCPSSRNGLSACTRPCQAWPEIWNAPNRCGRSKMIPLFFCLFRT
jgi:hypothetical protein